MDFEVIEVINKRKIGREDEVSVNKIIKCVSITFQYWRLLVSSEMEKFTETVVGTKIQFIMP